MKIATSFKVPVTQLNELQKVIEQMIKDKAEILPSFKLTHIRKYEQDGANFLHNLCTFVLEFSQTDTN